MTILPSKETLVLEMLPNKTDTGYYVANSDDRKQPEKGVVIAIGKGELPIEVKVGDTVFYEKYADFKIQVTGDTELIFIRFDKLLGKLMPEKETKKK